MPPESQQSRKFWLLDQALDYATNRWTLRRTAGHFFERFRGADVVDQVLSDTCTAWKYVAARFQKQFNANADACS